MWSSKFTFKSLNHTLAFLVKSKNKDLIDDFLLNLYEIFGNPEAKKIEGLQKNNINTKKKIDNFILKFKSKFPPEINNLSAFLRKLDEDEYFLFLPNIDLTIEDSSRLHNYLVSLNSNESFESLNEKFEASFGKLLNEYHLRAFGSYRLFVGNKTGRKCRFCKKEENKTTFKNKAHAISEGLGNKKIFIYDECDYCNDKFSIEVEPDLINYFSIFRTFFDVKGKGGNKKIKGKNFEISRKKDVEINFQTSENTPDLNKNLNQYDLKLNLNEKINLQDIYRCLVKFCISVIDSSEIKSFSKTIDWINKDIKIKKLPKIGELISYNHFTNEPKLLLYKRRTDNMKIPYMVGEFHLTCKIMVFIIPLSSEDKYDFTDSDKFDEFWKTFNHYKRINDWSFKDFSQDEEKDFTFNLVFKGKGTN